MAYLFSKVQKQVNSDYPTNCEQGTLGAWAYVRAWEAMTLTWGMTLAGLSDLNMGNDLGCS